jgi:membrane-associated phospholipid phosphatase
MLLGRLTRSQSLEDTGNDLCRSLLASGAVVWSLKLAFSRTRPNGGQYSFPSGHTAAAFSVAPVIQKHFGLKAAIPAYALALATGLGRMEDSKHYLSDVLFGAFVGLTVGESVVGRDRAGYLGHFFSAGPPGVGFSLHF